MNSNNICYDFFADAAAAVPCRGLWEMEFARMVDWHTHRSKLSGFLFRPLFLRLYVNDRRVVVLAAVRILLSEKITLHRGTIKCLYVAN